MSFEHGKRDFRQFWIYPYLWLYNEERSFSPGPLNVNGEQVLSLKWSGKLSPLEIVSMSWLQWKASEEICKTNTVTAQGERASNRLFSWESEANGLGKCVHNNTWSRRKQQSQFEKKRKKTVCSFYRYQVNEREITSRLVGEIIAQLRITFVLIKTSRKKNNEQS